MKTRDAIGLALAQIRVQKLKSAFTLLGVTIGVMFLIAVVSIVEGMGRYVEEDFAARLRAGAEAHSNNFSKYLTEIGGFHNNPNFSNIIRAPEFTPPCGPWNNLLLPEEVQKWTH